MVLLLQEHRDQVRERLFAARIARQHLAILLHGFGVLAGLLQRDGLAEQRLFMLREQAEIFFQRLHRFGGAAVVNQRDAQPEQRIGARGVGVAGAAERRRRRRSTA